MLLELLGFIYAVLIGITSYTIVLAVLLALPVVALVKVLRKLKTKKA